jgi:hypothetical protein
MRKATVIFVMSVCPSVRLSAWNNSASIRQIFMKFYICIFLENLLRKFKFNYNMARIIGSLLEDQYTFISHSVLFRMRNVSDKSYRGSQNTHFILYIVSFSENRAVWDKVKTYCTGGQAIADNMAHAHCMLDAKGYKHAVRICNT